MRHGVRARYYVCQEETTGIAVSRLAAIGGAAAVFSRRRARGKSSEENHARNQCSRCFGSIVMSSLG